MELLHGADDTKQLCFVDTSQIMKYENKSLFEWLMAAFMFRRRVFRPIPDTEPDAWPKDSLFDSSGSSLSSRHAVDPSDSLDEVQGSFR